MGFISLLLIVLQTPITKICIPKSVGATWHPCKKGDKSSSAYSDSQNEGRKLLQILDSDFGSRRILAAKVIDKCTTKVKLAHEWFLLSLFLFFFSKYISIIVVHQWIVFYYLGTGPRGCWIPGNGTNKLWWIGCRSLISALKTKMANGN